MLLGFQSSNTARVSAVTATSNRVSSVGDLFQGTVGNQCGEAAVLSLALSFDLEVIDKSGIVFWQVAGGGMHVFGFGSSVSADNLILVENAVVVAGRAAAGWVRRSL